MLGIIFIIGCISAMYLGITSAERADKELVKNAILQTEEDMKEYKEQMEKL